MYNQRGHIAISYRLKKKNKKPVESLGLIKNKKDLNELKRKLALGLI